MKALATIGVLVILASLASAGVLQGDVCASFGCVGASRSGVTVHAKGTTP